MYKILLILIAIIMSFLNTIAQKLPKAPVAKEIPQTVTLNENTWVDEFSWLRDIKNPAVIEHLNAENKYTEDMMFGTKDLQKKLYDEILGRIVEDDSSVPFDEYGYTYFSKKTKGKEYPSIFRKEIGKGGIAEEILDLNTLAAQYPYFRLMDTKISPNNQWLSYTADTNGTNTACLFFKNLKSKETIKLSDKKVSSWEWLNNSKDFIFTTQNETNRSNKILIQNIDDIKQPAKQLFEEKDALFNLKVNKSLSGNFIFIESQSFTAVEIHFLNADEPGSKPILFKKREKGQLYTLDHLHDRFLYLSNHANINFELFSHPTTAFDFEKLKTIYGGRSGTYIYHVQAFQNFIALHEKSDARKSIRLISPEGETIAMMQPDSVSGTVNGDKNRNYNTNIYRYNISSFSRPLSTYDFDLKSKKHKLLKATEVPSGFDAKKYVENVIYAKAKDGKLIPISLFHLKDLKLNANNPTLLYGYGAYGIGTYLGFSPSVISLVDRGFVYAIAHVRGGDEMGYQWYTEGKMKQKMNSFNDFISCAEHLIQEKYTSPNHLLARGGSAGGLLMGAVVNARPDLFRAVVLQVPFVDVINTMMDESLPLTTEEYEQWGNVNIKEDFDYIRQYSPYENVKTQTYPMLLFTSGVKDQQVGYWEPAKMVAKIRKLNPKGLPVLFKCDMGMGHGGSPAFYKNIEEQAFYLAYMLSAVGIAE